MHLCETERRSRAKTSESGVWPKRPSAVPRPRLLLAHRDRAYRIRARGHFYSRQTEVRLLTATSTEEVYAITQRFKPAVVVLSHGLPGESGYLTCAKIKLTLPRCRVVLLEQDPSEEARRFARFVGAECIAERAPDPRHLAALAV